MGGKNCNCFPARTLVAEGTVEVGLSTGDVIEVTSEHPFYEENFGWLPAEGLQPGMWLRTIDGAEVTVAYVQDHPTRGPPTYNFEVQGLHNYFVAPAGVLAHNVSCGGGSGKKGLLPREGKVGTYDEMISIRQVGDNLTPHHIPSANHMKKHGVSKGDGISMNMEQPFPGVGGRHRETFTYGTNADVNLSPRDALGRGVRDARRIYQKDGLYGPQIRSSLQEVIRKNKRSNPGLFDK